MRTIGAIPVLALAAAGVGSEAGAGPGSSAAVSASARQDQPPLVPRIDGPWWQVAGDPDLGRHTSPKQQPVDFGIWQAADGTWQLWSCIRNTQCGGKTRLFHRWEGSKLTDPNWRPCGIAMEADPAVGETAGGLQAPFVLAHEGKYLMFYGDWENICMAVSQDGKSFQRRLRASGKTGMFSEGGNTRDPMVLRAGGVFHCYYTAHPGQKGADYCRTSKDLQTWSDSRIVARAGSAGDGPYSAECPFVVHLPQAGRYYLFRTQRYGANAQASVYCSADPLDFGVVDDRYLACRLPVAAPEIILHEGQWYIAALLPSLKGIQIARLRWAAPSEPPATKEKAP